MDQIFTAETLGYLASGLVLLTFLMKTMTWLRMIAIVSNVAFILYAWAFGLTPILILHAILLPLNIGRLLEIRRHARMADAAAGLKPGEDSFDWLITLADRRMVPNGTTLFHKGDVGRSLFVIVDGEVFLPEIDVVLKSGAMLGEISLFSAEGKRTLTAVARGPVELAELTERRVREIYFDNPEFAYSLIRVITSRLVSNMGDLESRLAALKTSNSA
jgi:hypothetical protein